ncbi:hypothetical protein RvY_03271 [Ramazzottius varieornatus]|uniref:Uncharacterized protein n=1 Tax=Ramazzottius varieornatus TaxID=947166 RepID=A0A1D1UQX3_RAMVA|nr:hypothetical protein RvY_03271 [Ramazzottius varieornatus]
MTADSSESGYPARSPSSAGFKKARRARKEMGKDSPPKRFKADNSCDELLAINAVNLFQFPLEPAYKKARKNAFSAFHEERQPAVYGHHQGAAREEWRRNPQHAVPRDN